MDISPHQSADKGAARDRKKMEKEVLSPRSGLGPRKSSDHLTTLSLPPRKPADHLGKLSSKPEQLHKQAKLSRPAKDPSRNYMKPTKNTKARKECSEVCTHKPCSDETKQIPKAKDSEISTHNPFSDETKQTPLPRDSGISTQKPCPDETKQKTLDTKDASTSSPPRGPPVASGQSKPVKALQRKPNVRQLRPSRMAIPGNTLCHKHGHTCGPTCSSTLKDAAFPQELEVTHGGSTVKKVCSYSCCSLNAHENPPTVKHPFLRRKVSIKAQRSFRVRGVSSSVPRKRGVRKVDKKSDTDRHMMLGAESASEVTASRKRGVRKVDQHMPLPAKSASAVSALDKEVSVEKRGLQTTVRVASVFNNDEDDGFLDSKDRAGSDQITHPDTCSMSMSFEEQVDQDSEFSNSEVDIIRDFLVAVESDNESTPTESEVDVMAKDSNRWLFDNGIFNKLCGMSKNYPEEESRASISETMSNQWKEEMAEFHDVSAKAIPHIIAEGDHKFKNSKDATEILTTQAKESKQQLQPDANYALASGALISANNTLVLDDLPAQAPAIFQSNDNEVTIMTAHGDQNSENAKNAAAQEATKAENMKSDDILDGAIPDKDNELLGRDLSVQCEASEELKISEQNFLHGDGHKTGNNETEYTSGQPEVHAAVPSLGTDQSISMDDRAESDVSAENIISEAKKYLGMDLEFPEEEGCFSTDFEGQAEDEYLRADIELLLEEYLPSGHETIDGKETTAGVMEVSEPSSQTNSKLETRLSIKKNLIKKCFEKLRTIRQLTRASCLPTVEEENQRKIELRQMMMLDRKNAEEWMIDHKLRLLIDQLAKAQKKKVELLVEAYESIMPKATRACN